MLNPERFPPWAPGPSMTWALSVPERINPNIKEKIMSIDDFIKKAATAAALNDFLGNLSEAVNTKKSEDKINQLFKARDALQVNYDFAVGDLVTWKKGLRNMNFQGPFLILELLAEPIVDRELTHVTSYSESMDTLILFIDKDGDACRSLVSRARIEPYKAEETEEAPATEA